MLIKNLRVLNFRNITQLTIDCHARFNLMTGKNGAGKTSILEAIHIMATGKSFRTHLPSRFIAHNHPTTTITAQVLTSKSTELPVLIGLEKHRTGERKLKINREPTDSTAKIAEICPIQMIPVDCYRLFSDGPKSRRSFLDWGVFHVEPSFLNHALHYNRALKQRNALLKNKSQTSTITSWDQILILHGEAIDTLRSSYLTDLKGYFYNSLAQLLGNVTFNCELSYKRGWSNEDSLRDAFSNSIERDKKYGATHVGPHRADCQLFIDKIPACDELSQGQLKVATYALKLAQGQLLKAKTGKTPIFLIDDLPSELDTEKQGAVISILKSLSCQAFITAITDESLLPACIEEGASVFHVEHGTHINQHVSTT